ncbi:phosphatidylserine decarboxylase [Lachnospiraceae bacterium 62-35]
MTKDPLYVRFLYETTPGRTLLKTLARSLFSRRAALFLDSSWSRWIIPLYIKFHHIPMESYISEHYRSFNHFFTRKRNCLYINPDLEPSHFISPCDGYLSVYPITRESRFHIKHLEYSLEKLLHDSALAARYQDGLCLIFRLAPHNYHRYCYPDNGLAVKQVSIPGLLHSVRPSALKTSPVFLENARQYTVIDSENFGLLVQMEVGALLVGKIHNHIGRLIIERCTEKGYFEFGGSTILILAEQGILDIDQPILSASQKGLETTVTYGEKIAARRLERV